MGQSAAELLACVGSENVHSGFYFADLIFMVCQSTAKTAKIGSLKNFRLYGNQDGNPGQTLSGLVSGTLTLYTHVCMYSIGSDMLFNISSHGVQR